MTPPSSADIRAIRRQIAAAPFVHPRRIALEWDVPIALIRDLSGSAKRHAIAALGTLARRPSPIPSKGTKA